MLTVQRAWSLLIVGFLTAVPISHAASGLTLPDLSSIESLVQLLLDEQTRQDADRAFDDSTELFPLTGQSTENPDYVTMRIGAARIVLQDVPLREWFAPYVRNIAELGLVSGYRDAQNVPTGFFGPADPVTLEQMVKVVVLGAGIDPASCGLPPANLSASGAWSASFVRCAEARQWAVYADASTDVRRPATREEVVMTVLQAFGREFSADTGAMAFSDVEQTGAFAPAIAQAAKDGVVSGYADAHGEPTGLFGPTNNVTRAEFSKIVSIALQLYVD